MSAVLELGRQEDADLLCLRLDTYANCIAGQTAMNIVFILATLPSVTASHSK